MGMGLYYFLSLSLKRETGSGVKDVRETKEDFPVGPEDCPGVTHPPYPPGDGQVLSTTAESLRVQEQSSRCFHVHSSVRTSPEFHVL